MRTKEEMLENELGSYLKIREEDLGERISKVIQEYADQECDKIQELFTKPLLQLKPLEDLWRKENSPDRFVIPDSTKFYKWIVNKILNDK